MNLAKSTPAGIKTLHEQMRPLIDQNVREVEKRKQSGTAVTPHPNWFKMLEEAPVVVRIPHFDSVADGIIQHGRLRNLLETGKGMGIQNKGIRQEAEHNVLNIPLDTPETERPIYGMLGVDHYMHNNGIVHEKRFELAPSPHYGSIIAVVKPHVKERSSFVEGDSLDDKKYHTLFDSKTLHNFPYVAMNSSLDPHERYSAFGDPVDVTGVGYIEAQIHGGVDFAKDVDSLHVRMPKSFFHENPHELVNMANSMKQEVDKLEGTSVFLMTQEQRSRIELLRARIENVRSLLNSQRIGKHFGIPVHAHLIDDSGQQKKRFIRESDIDGPRVGTHVFSFAQQAPNTTDTLELLNRFEQALDNLAKMAKPNVSFPQLSTRSPSAAPIVKPAIVPYRAGLMGQDPSADYSQVVGATIQRGSSKPVKEEGKAGRANPTFHQSGFIASGRTGKEIAATEGHEKWHTALQDLRAKYHPAAVFDLITKLGGRVHNDIYANPVSKHLFDIAVKETPAEQKNGSPYEEFFAYVHTFLNDPTFRKQIHENLGMMDAQAQRDAYKHVDGIRKQAQVFADTFDESMIDPQYIPKTTQAPTGVLKSEDLEKGSLQRRNRFIPSVDNYRQSKGLLAWQTGEEGEKDFSPVEGEARFRTLHKLHGVTKVRRSSAGEREFLLWRGHHPDEFNTSGSHILTLNQTGWTPKSQVALDFAEDPNDKITAAWIPESSIVVVPRQLGTLRQNKFGANEMAGEYEVIVNPNKFELANTHTRSTFLRETMKSEESLIKVSRTPEEMSADMTPHKPNHYEAYDTIETFPVGEAEWMAGRKGMLYHHVYKKPATKNGYVSYLHAISVDPNPLNETGIISSSTMGTESVQKFLADPFPAPKDRVNVPWKDGEVASIGETATDVPAQKRGLATLLYLDALKYHGRLMSDTLTSEGADKVWEKILKHPEVTGCHGHGDPFHRHWAEWKGDKSVPSNVIQMGGKSIAQMELGKSEDILDTLNKFEEMFDLLFKDNGTK
jgi:hypothetical protein